MAGKITLLMGGAALVVLTACTNPGQPTNTEAGAATGAMLGGLAGLLSGGDNRLGRTAVGAGFGAVVGGMIGSSLDAQAAELQRDMGDGVTVRNTGSEILVSVPQDILFATDSATVSGGSYANLRTLASSLVRYPDTLVEVVGHTDSTGTAEYNQGLSERRAQAVAAVLRSEGVAANRVVAYGRGETQPVATNLTPEGRAANRRVEVIIRPVQ